jgi:hypothetical protein
MKTALLTEARPHLTVRQSWLSLNSTTVTFTLAKLIMPDLSFILLGLDTKNILADQHNPKWGEIRRHVSMSTKTGSSRKQTIKHKLMTRVMLVGGGCLTGLIVNSHYLLRRLWQRVGSREKSRDNRSKEAWWRWRRRGKRHQNQDLKIAGWRRNQETKRR